MADVSDSAQQSPRAAQRWVGRNGGLDDGEYGLLELRADVLHQRRLNDGAAACGMLNRSKAMILTDEKRMVRDTARSFARESLVPCAAALDRAHQFPAEALREIGRLGLMGMVVPPEWDGAGTDHVACALVLEEIAAGEGATSTIMSVNNLVGCMQSLKFGLCRTPASAAASASPSKTIRRSHSDWLTWTRKSRWPVKWCRTPPRWARPASPAYEKPR